MALCLGFPWEEKNPQDPPILRMHPMCQGWGGAETPRSPFWTPRVGE